MRRRSMIRAALGAAMLGALPRAGRSALEGSTLIAVAATLAPSDDWADSNLAGALWGSFAALESNERGKTTSALDRLDKAAGGSFANLPPDKRMTVLADLVENDADFAGAFGTLRALVLDVYFTSSAGLAFTGYRDCTQFAGYPEYFAQSSEWE